jgi:hypothetical protein
MLYQIIDLFGEDILDELFSPVNNKYSDPEHVAAEVAEKLEHEIIEKQFADDTPTIQHTRTYARGVFGALATGENDLNEAGFRQWRHEKSLPGAVTYELAIKAGKTFKEAWCAFWNAGCIVSLSPRGATVKSVANGRVQPCTWSLVRWKLANGEIFLTKADRACLKEVLQTKGWGSELIPAL